MNTNVALLLGLLAGSLGGRTGGKTPHTGAPFHPNG